MGRERDRDKKGGREKESTSTTSPSKIAQIFSVSLEKRASCSKALFEPLIMIPLESTLSASAGSSLIPNLASLAS